MTDFLCDSWISDVLLDVSVKKDCWTGYDPNVFLLSIESSVKINDSDEIE
jgi:hypothetical protein